MNTNEKIAKWLGLQEKYITNFGIQWVINLEDSVPINLDFLHDRNQQGWIIDELIKRGWRIKIYICEQTCEVKIWHNDDQIEVIGDNEDLDLAFISAVEQLINQEETK